MQDKPHSDFDPRLMDRGWELLRPQLDEALPVADNRRRLAYWWWVALGLLLIGITIGFSQLQWQTVPASGEPAAAARADSPVAAKEEGALNSPVVQIRPDESAASGNTTTRKQDNTRPGSFNLAPSTPMTNPAMATLDVEHSSPGPIPSESVEDAAVPAGGDKTAAVVIGPEAATATAAALKPARRATTIVTTLPSLSLRSAASGQSLAAAVVSSLTPAAKMLSAHYFVSTRAGVSLGQPSYSQLGLGVEGQFRLSRRWQLGAGIYYQETWPGSVRSVSEDNSGGFSPVEGANTPAFDNAGRLNVSSPLLEQLYTRQLGLELRGLLRLSPRWQISAGAELVNYRAAYLRQSENLNSNPATAADLNNFNVYNNEVRVVGSSREEATAGGREPGIPLDLNRWQWVAAVGVQYQLHPKWQVGLDWRRQLSEWSESIPELQTQSAVQLRLSYRLR